MDEDEGAGMNKVEKEEGDEGGNIVYIFEDEGVDEEVVLESQEGLVEHREEGRIKSQMGSSL